MDAAAVKSSRPRLGPGARVRPWLVLGRVSNLPTVWSNCLAGWLLGGGGLGWPFILVALAASLLYTGGMYLNDSCDLAFDRQFRPERPIPGGLVSGRVVLTAAMALLVFGVALLAPLGGRTLCLGAALAVLIVVYNVTHKRGAFGPLLMAGCRFLLYILAASAAAFDLRWQVIAFGLGLAAYIFAISLLARTESRGAQPVSLWLPFALVPLLVANAIHLSWSALGFSIPLIGCLILANRRARESIGRAVTLLLAAIVLLDLLAVSPRNLMLITTFAALFLVTLIFQRYIPAT